MNKTVIKLIILIAGAILFNIFFWSETMGVNIFIFSILTIAVNVYYFPQIKNSIPALACISGTLVAAFGILLHSSVIAVVAFILSYIITIGFIHYSSLHSILFAFPASVSDFFASPKGIMRELDTQNLQAGRIKRIWRFIKIAIIPIIILYVFYWIFKFANPVFDHITDSFFSAINERIVYVFKTISITRFLLFVFGLFILSWGLFGGYSSRAIQRESKLNETIERKRRVPKYSGLKARNAMIQPVNFHYYKTIPLNLKLKNEFRAAILLILSVNILLLIVNVIDIVWVWFGFDYGVERNLSQFVHEGTYLLIISILLSIAILLYFYRRNLNFYPKAHFLKNISYIWIIQNIVLTISVGIRNYHYINYYGLAYKRIGVIIFLCLTIFGLYSLFMKIRHKKSGFYLFRVNGWALYVVLILMSCINWDVWIARYNISHPTPDGKIDVYFLLTLSDKALPIIHQNQYLLEQEINAKRYKTFYPKTYKEYFYSRVDKFIGRKENTTWLSWNNSEYKAYKYLKNNVKK